MTKAERFRKHIKAHLSWTPKEKIDRIRFLSLALCGEVGEIANLLKKDWRGDEGDRSKEIIKEVADVGNYTFMLAEVLGVDLVDAMLKKNDRGGKATGVEGRSQEN